jgi:ABC-type sugar transport system ATPase subunit
MTGEQSTPAGAPVAPRLAATDLRKSFGTQQAVRGVSFAIAAGEVHGLCGPNGAGKSTIVKMLAGQVVPDAGTIALDGRPLPLDSPQAAQRGGIAVVDQELSVVPALTVAENLALGTRASGRGRAAAAATRGLLDDVGLAHVDPHATLGGLSLGERQLVEIARGLGREARLLILDEPTATLSDREIERVFAAVRRVTAHGRSVVFVSHRLGEVMELCDRVTVVRDGQLVATTPTAELTIGTLIAQMVGSVAPASRRSVAAGERPPRLVVDGLRVGETLRPFSLVAVPGQIYALAGQLGSGATTVVRALAGLEPTARGTVTVADRGVTLASPIAAARAGIAFISGDRKGEGLFLQRTVGENLVATRLDSLTSFGLLRRRRERAASAAIAAGVGLAPAQVDLPVDALSGGNQQKALVGRALERDDISVLVLDEPTRGVDVAGRAVIHDLLRAAADRGLVVIFSSTDLDELVSLGDVVVTLWAGRQVGRHDVPASSEAVLADITHRQVAA